MEVPVTVFQTAETGVVNKQQHQRNLYSCAPQVRYFVAQAHISESNKGSQQPGQISEGLSEIQRYKLPEVSHPLCLNVFLQVPNYSSMIFILTVQQCSVKSLELIGYLVARRPGTAAAAYEHPETDACN